MCSRSYFLDMTEFTKTEIEQRLNELEGWEYSDEDGRIKKKYDFDTYMDGIEFVNEIAELAEDANHHPDMILGFREVKVTLKSHDVDAITERDFSLAEEIEGLV